eukprot:s1800_g16.t1
MLNHSNLLKVDKKGQPHPLKPFVKTMELNIVGTFLIASKGAALMAENSVDDAEGERGCIINVASVAAQDGQNGQIAYSAGKGGIMAMTLPMARDLGKQGIRVNCILPGVFETPMTEPLKQFRPAVYKNLTESNIFPNNRLGLPEDFAKMAVAILENKYMNGESIRIDAGIRMGKLFYRCRSLVAILQDYHEAAVALRNCVRSCALLMNQRGLVSNADRHVVAMTQHLFYEVLPMPLPISKGVSACFWRKMPMYYETQASLVRELWLVVQYFLASSLSLPLNTHHHSVRLLTLVSALSVLDAVVRRNPPHSQNDLSRVYSGALRGSAKSGAFAVDLRLQLAESTEELPLWDPHAQEIRSGLLDYFATAGDTHSRKARRVFGFNDMRLNAGDKELIHRLALLRGCVSGSCAPESSRWDFKWCWSRLEMVNPDVMYPLVT